MKYIVPVSQCSGADNSSFSFVLFINALVVSNKVVIPGTHKYKYLPKLAAES